jgi:abequosyltransferase
MEPTLTIAIPTYNRQVKARRICEQLMEQTKSVPGINILVVDNHSIPAVYDTTTHKVPHGIIYKRNHANIGLSGNIIRCIELCETEYLWYLCDDDELLPNFLDIILDALSRNVDFVNFSSHRNYPNERIVLGESILDEMEYANMAFIAACILNVKSLTPFLGYGYRFSNTLVPHLAMLFRLAFENPQKCQIYLSKSCPVKWRPGADNWNQLYYLENIYLLGGLAITGIQKEKIISKSSSIVHPRDAAASTSSEFLMKKFHYQERFSTVLRIYFCAYGKSSLRLRALWLLYGFIIAISPVWGTRMIAHISKIRGRAFNINTERDMFDRV